MNEKLEEKIDELGELIEDWNLIDSADLQEQAVFLIIKKATELLDIAAEEIEPPKSEIACNCPPVKTLKLDAETKAALKDFFDDIFG